MNATTMTSASLSETVRKNAFPSFAKPALLRTLASGARVLFMTAFVIALFLFVPPLAFAQTETQSQSQTKTKTTTTTTTTSTSTNSKEPKKTTVNFEDQLIEGQTQKPELFYLLQQRSNNFKRLIKLRENFLPEMRDTAEDISRHGSGH